MVYIMDSLSRLLHNIKENPGAVIGKKSLDRLSTFVYGYLCCMYERDGVYPAFLPGFQEYVEERYGIHTAHHWSEIIQFFCKSEEEAFGKFYELLDEFTKKGW
jgi:hypothetical protein